MDHPLFARIMGRVAELEERRGAPALRRELLAGLHGQVVEVGPGTGVTFPYYPATVTKLTAVEPETTFRRLSTEAAADAAIDIEVVEGLADSLPMPDASADALVVSGVLCSVPDQSRALQEFARVLKPGGELRFFEHVEAGAARLRALQRLFDATFWPSAMGGCHLTRDTRASIEAAGLRIASMRRFAFLATPLALPASPRILGIALKPA